MYIHFLTLKLLWSCSSPPSCPSRSSPLYTPNFSFSKSKKLIQEQSPQNKAKHYWKRKTKHQSVTKEKHTHTHITHSPLHVGQVLNMRSVLESLTYPASRYWRKLCSLSQRYKRRQEERCPFAQSLWPVEELFLFPYSTCLSAWLLSVLLCRRNNLDIQPSKFHWFSVLCWVGLVTEALEGKHFVS